MGERTIRRADEPEARAAAIEVARLGFGSEDEPLRFLASRLASPRRHVAVPWLVEAEGRVVSSLASFPLSFRTPDGKELRGIGLGSVATHPDARRQGHGEALCRHVVEDAEQNGAPVALLFSAIEPALYERVGFRVCDAWNFICKDLGELATSAPKLDWQPFDPLDEIASLGRIYDLVHRGSMHLSRDVAAWEHSIKIVEPSLWFGIGSPLKGYARIFVEGEKLFLSELFFEESNPELESQALAGLASMGMSWGCTQILTWLRPSEATTVLFHDQGRAKTLPMLRGSMETQALWVWASDYF